jgi:protein-disulfide isomerase
MLSRLLIAATVCLLASPLVFGWAGTEVRAQTEEKEKTEEAKTEAGPSEEEILRQLQEVMDQLNALRIEVGALRKAVDDIHRVAVRPRTPPAPASIALDDDEAMGSAEATVAIVEFSDFQCPYCRRFHNQTFPQLKDAYIDTGKIQYIFRDFPLEQLHSQAVTASIAANCAGQQGKYWEMHHEVFMNQNLIGPALFTELAESLELDLKVFATCLEDPAQREEIEKDLVYGQSVGVRGTPHYFIGRIEGDTLVDVKRVSGAQPFQAFASIIDSLLQ